MAATRKGALGCLVALAALFLVAGDALAQAGISQYLIGRDGGRSLKLWNPSGTEMFAAALYYSGSGSFTGCDSALVAAKGLDTGLNSGSYYEIISVPSSGKAAARVKSPPYGLGGMLKHGQNLGAVKPSKFQLPKDKTERSALMACVCTELSNAALPSNLLKGFKIKCK